MVPLSGWNPRTWTWSWSRVGPQWIRNYPIGEGISEVKLQKEII